MSATDDATRPPHAARPRRAWPGVAAVLLACAFLGAGLLGVLAGRFAPGRYALYEARVRWQGGPPAPGEWPRAARAGEQVIPFEVGGRTLLAVRSSTAAGTEALARDLQRRRLSGVDGAAERRAVARSRWRASRSPGASSSLPPAGRCAALVRARLLLIVLVDPRVPPVSPVTSAGTSSRHARLARAEDEVVRLARAARPDSLASALTACAAAEGEWLRALAAEPAADPRARIEAAWSWHERARAPVLDHVERTLESTLSKSQHDAVLTAAFDRALALERLAPDPSALLFTRGAWGPAAGAFPIVRTWFAFLTAGLFAGAALGLALCVPRLRRRSRPRAARLVRGVPAALSLQASGEGLAQLPRDPRRAWEAELGWLHVVSGPDPARIAHAAETLAGGFLERGERVLLVDAGERLRLHERYGADTRWGLGECLAGEVPLLGAVQAAGRAGFFLLAHGAPGKASRWDGMSGLLEDARAHFGRVLLALDPRVPRAAALPFGGRVLEAWWAEPGPGLPKGAVALSERLGIPFTCFELNWLTQAMLEVEVAARVRDAGSSQSGEECRPAPTIGLAGVGALARAVPGQREEAPNRVESVPASADATDAAAAPEGETMVLGCDPEVRQRLRFLIWMRRVQAERRAPALETGAGR